MGMSSLSVKMLKCADRVEKVDEEGAQQDCKTGHLLQSMGQAQG
jgi:hypothetical protein